MRYDSDWFSASVGMAFSSCANQWARESRSWLVESSYSLRTLLRA